MIINEFDKDLNTLITIFEKQYNGNKKIKELYGNISVYDFFLRLKNNQDQYIGNVDDKNFLIKFFSLLKEESSNQLKKINSNKIEYDFPHKNLLLKGVPGTGKSHTLDQIIKEKLNLKDKPQNILRINIHSASSNADLMQGIGIAAKENQIEYKEKQGLIFNHIRKACFAPHEPFVLVLEEIQENSLNELIGDLIYLIEDSKRANLALILENHQKDFSEKDWDYQELINAYLEKSPQTHSVQIPYLVENHTEYRRMIFPDNLYVFCTSNYRDDKKVIEDNLLRRFDVVELYPQYQEQLGDDFKSKEVSDFLKNLNEAVLQTFLKHEIHPDRFLIGHANWINIADKDESSFYKAFLKVVVEFKEIRELDYERSVKEILKKLDEKIKTHSQESNWVASCFNELLKHNENYKTLVDFLQKEVYQDILSWELKA